MGDRAAKKTIFSPFGLLLATILALGIFFRSANLDSKIFWIDEVATAIRISGYTKSEVIQKLAQLDVITVADLQKYQKIAPERGLNDTLYALSKSPEHAPLYFLLARFWTQLWGSSVVCLRSLSVIFSLIAIPTIYWLGLELFKLPLVAGISAALLTVSPFYVAYAQEARPYSLWTVTIILSGATLLRAIGLGDRASWLFYTSALILGFYTSLLSLLVAFGQGIYVIFCRDMKVFKNYIAASGLALIGFIPWLLVIGQNLQKLEENTTWMTVPIDISAMVGIWLYTVFIVFFENPNYQTLYDLAVSRIWADIGLLILIVYGFIFLVKRSPKAVWLFVLTLAGSTPLVLIAIDLIFQREGSTAPRYMNPSHLGIQLAVAYLLANKITLNNRYQKVWQGILAIVISLGIISCILILDVSPKYQKSRNLHNTPIANIINQAQQPKVLIEEAQMLDMLSLSYQLDPKVKIYLASKLKGIEKCHGTFLFNPSSEISGSIEDRKDIELVDLYHPKRLIPTEISLSLWQVRNLNSNCKIN